MNITRTIRTELVKKFTDCPFFVPIRPQKTRKNPTHQFSMRSRALLGPSVRIRLSREPYSLVRHEMTVMCRRQWLTDYRVCNIRSCASLRAQPVEVGTKARTCTFHLEESLCCATGSWNCCPQTVSAIRGVLSTRNRLICSLNDRKNVRFCVMLVYVPLE